MSNIPSKKLIWYNYSILDKTGKLLCTASEEKINWYLGRNLATKINDTTIQLLFETNGPGCQGLPYALSTKENVCAVCGKNYDLNRHHVVPYWLLQTLPP